MKKTIYFIVFIFSIHLQSCYVLKAYKHRKFELDDLKSLTSDTLKPSDNKSIFPYNLNKYDKLSVFLDTHLVNSFTYSFLVIKNDSIIYEKYFDKVSGDTKQPSFSVAKSFVATLLQIAVQDGFIKNFEEPITNYLPNLLKRDSNFKQITVQQVLNMASGIKSSENYGNPFSDVLKLGFSSNINKHLKRLSIEKKPGDFEYKSVNTQILAAIIENSTKRKFLDYFYEKIWNPLGMEFEATWNIDSKENKTVRAFCCLNAATKDFAKLGKLYLQKGHYNGVEILNSKFISETIHPDSMLKNGGYKNQWWATEPYIYFDDSLKAISYIEKTKATKFEKKIEYKGKMYFIVKDYLPAFYANGILEQYIYVNPRTQTIIVRLGHHWNNKKYSSLRFIETANRIIENP